MYLLAKKNLLAAVTALALLWPAASAQAVSSEKEFTQMLEKVLQSNPDLVLDVLRKHSEAVLDIAQQGSNVRREHNLMKQWREDLKTTKTVALKDRPVLGSTQAKVRIVAFSDFSCHFCQQAYTTIEKLRKEYGDNICLVFKHLPLDEKGPAGLASAYFVAIAQQSEEKAWDFYRVMFEQRDKLMADGESFLKTTAKDLDLDMKKLNRDLRSRKVPQILKEDLEDAQKLGVEGTPYFLVNNLVVRGALPLELFKSAVDMAMNPKGK